MKSFLDRYGGADWVVASWDDWTFGNNKTPDGEGGWTCENSAIARAVARLKPARTRDGKLVELCDVSLRPDALTPAQRLLRKETYGMDVWCTVRVDGVPRRGKTRVGRFPCMVTQPPEDCGHFIVDGMERAFVNREARRYDTPRFRHNPTKSKYAYVAELTSLDAPFSVAYNTNSETMVAQLGFASNPIKIDVDVLLKALGETDGLPDVYLSDPDAQNPDDEDEALEIVGKALMGGGSGGLSNKKLRAFAQEAMHERLLPFLRREEKAERLRALAGDLFKFARGELEASDMDAMEHKRIDTAGKFVIRMVCTKLREMWNRAAEAMLRSKKKAADPEAFLDLNHIEAGVCAGMKVSVNPDEKAASVLPRKASWQEACATIRRVTADVNSSSYVVGPRMFHGTSYGFYCACETQEGARTGLSRETTLFFRCSPHGDPEAWARALLREDLGSGDARVYVNQSCRVRDVDFQRARDACERLKRRSDPYASLVCDPEARELRVDTSEGRAMRPVWVLDAEGRPPPVDLVSADFDASVRAGHIEWIDAWVASTTLVATTIESVVPGRHARLELHPTSLYAPSAANIPFADHNAGARNLFGAHVRHQAVGASPFPHAPVNPNVWHHERFDADESHRLWYPQRAMCDTTPARCGKSHEHPGGWNAVIFILAKPYGQEDSMGIARRHIDLGGGACETEIAFEEKLNEKDGERWGSVAPNRKLDADGFVRVGEVVFPGDALAAKRRGVNEDATKLFWRKKHAARVAAVCRIGDDMVRIRLVWRRTPEIGDKFASRHGQKGVMNFYIEESDTYWTKDGVTPDIIMNPAALPSRMTIGHVFEMLAGKANALAPPAGFSQRGCEGSPTDCTPYSSSFDYAEIQNILRRCGFQPKGHELVYNARTGELMRDCHVFMGPAFMQRLVHFAFPKCYARGRGVRNPQTGQPPRGRDNEGGLKLGEGETKAQQAHGGAYALRTAHLECSDGIQVWACAACREVSTSTKCAFCGRINNNTHAKTVPRTFLLLRDQLRVARIDTCVV